jgi:hypothetical protein
MRVRLTSQISGTRNGQEWPEPGTEIDLPDDEARNLLTAGTAVEVGHDAGSVMVPPAGVHTPATPATDEARREFVEAAGDALADPDGTARAMRDAREGNTTQVPTGVGVQHPDGRALTPEELDESTEAERVNREAWAPAKVGQDKSTKSAPAKADKK